MYSFFSYIIKLFLKTKTHLFLLFYNKNWNKDQILFRDLIHKKANKNEYKRKPKNKKDAREKKLLKLQPGSFGSINSCLICSHIGKTVKLSFHFPAP